MKKNIVGQSFEMDSGIRQQKYRNVFAKDAFYAVANLVSVSE